MFGCTHFFKKCVRCMQILKSVSDPCISPPTFIRALFPSRAPRLAISGRMRLTPKERKLYLQNENFHQLLDVTQPPPPPSPPPKKKGNWKFWKITNFHHGSDMIHTLTHSPPTYDCDSRLGHIWGFLVEHWEKSAVPHLLASSSSAVKQPRSSRWLFCCYGACWIC